MSDTTPARAHQPGGLFTKGGAPGPGRPKGGHYTRIVDELRRLADATKIAEFVCGLALDATADIKHRKWAVDFITDRCEGKPVQSVDMRSVHVDATPGLAAANLAVLSDEDFAALGALLRRALPAPQGSPLPADGLAERTVIDVPGEPGE